MKRVLKYQAAFLVKRSNNLSLRDAASEGDIERVKLLLSQGEEINATDEDGLTPL